MLDRLMPFIPPRARETLRALAARRPAQETVVASLERAAPLAPMRPLHPPAAINDNPMRAVHEAVERELRASGHLR